MKKLFTFVIALIFTILVMGKINSCSSGQSSYEPDQKIEAFTYSKGFVEKILKAPSTADFCSYSDANVYTSGTGYSVTGWVDAENSFGAKLRSPFTVQLHKSGDNWICDGMEFDGQTYY